MKRIATEKARPETTAIAKVTYGIPGTSFMFKLGSVPCHTFNGSDTIIFLPSFAMSRIIDTITGSSVDDYKDKINSINLILKCVGVDKHVRHELERELIRVWGGHEHLKHIRRIFL